MYECRDTYGFVCYVSGVIINLFSKFKKKTLILDFGELSMPVYRPIPLSLFSVTNSYICYLTMVLYFGVTIYF